MKALSSLSLSVLKEMVLLIHPVEITMPVMCLLCPHSRKILEKQNKNLALSSFSGLPWVTEVVSCHHLVSIELV